jgi:methylated-DNA-[protein]-cysteine S-methyltransferase
VRATPHRYAAPGWGAGELWVEADRVVEHVFTVERSGGFLTGSDPVRKRAPNSADFVSEVIARVRGFLAGEAVELADVPLDLDWCTPFQRAVVDVLRSVPRGELVTYGELAALAGAPGAARAAGTVCAQNRFWLFVPCHRVVAAGGIGGYGASGVELKRRLLRLEGHGSFS